MTKEYSTDSKSVNYLVTSVSVMSNNIEYIKSDIKDLKEAQQRNFVTKDEFYPIKRAVYWMIGALGAISIAVVVFLLQKALS